jgi:hypothetical protein
LGEYGVEHAYDDTPSDGYKSLAAVANMAAQASWGASETLATPMSSVGAFNLNNQQTSFNGAAWLYDLSGDPTNGANQTYTFDARHQLRQIDQGVVPVASFQYDAFGRRTSKTIHGATTTYLYDGENPIQETQGSRVSPILTGLGIDERFARTEAAGRRCFLTDALTDTMVLVDAGQAIRQTCRYKPAMG